jgi:hypothetical protein
LNFPLVGHWTSDPFNYFKRLFSRETTLAREIIRVVDLEDGVKKETLSL